MEQNEFNCKMTIKAAELEQKTINLAKLTKWEKKGESISLLNSFIKLMTRYQKAGAVALKILPTKKVVDAYMTAQMACIDFIDTVADGMIKTVENHNKSNKQ